MWASSGPYGRGVLRALIVANGDMPSPSLLHQYAALADLVVAADGGGDKALAAGLMPGAVVGDLDSLSPDGRQQVGEDRVHRDADAETTDLEKAIAYALAAGATRIDVAGAGGGRADHALANLSVLVNFAGSADVRIIDDHFEIRRVQGETVIEGESGTVVSLLALGECTGVTTSGLRWPLDDVTLHFSPRGVHNEIAEPPATVRVAAGDLLLFQGRWVERHR